MKFRFKNFIKFTSITLFLFGVILNSSGQDNLIYETVQSVNTLTDAEQIKYSKVTASPLYSEHYFIKIESLVAMQEDGEIQIDIPNDNCDKLKYQAKTVRYNNEGDYTWHGKLKPQVSTSECDCIEGEFILISSAYGKIGHITVDDKAYEITQIGGETFMLSKINDINFTEFECGVDKNVIPLSLHTC